MERGREGGQREGEGENGVRDEGRERRRKGGQREGEGAREEGQREGEGRRGREKEIPKCVILL